MVVLLPILKFLGLTKVGQIITILITFFVVVTVLFIASIIFPSLFILTSLLIVGIIALGLSFVLPSTPFFKQILGKGAEINLSLKGIFAIGGIALMVLGLLSIPIGGFINGLVGGVIVPVGNILGTDLEATLPMSQDPASPFLSIALSIVASVVGAGIYHKHVGKVI